MAVAGLLLGAKLAPPGGGGKCSCSPGRHTLHVDTRRLSKGLASKGLAEQEIAVAVIDKSWTERFGGKPTVERFDAAAAQEALARVEMLARVMDGIVTIPGTNVRIGFDALLGLVPVIGDVISQAISSYIIWEARQLGVSRWTLTRMIGNSLVDMTIGAIPVVGDAFDVVFRANLKNLALLKAELERRGVATKTIDM